MSNDKPAGAHKIKIYGDYEHSGILKYFIGNGGKLDFIGTTTIPNELKEMADDDPKKQHWLKTNLGCQCNIKQSNTNLLGSKKISITFQSDESEWYDQAVLHLAMAYPGLTFEYRAGLDIRGMVAGMYVKICIKDRVYKKVIYDSGSTDAINFITMENLQLI